MQHTANVPAYVDQLASAALGGTLSRRAAYLAAQGARRRAKREAAALPELAGERWSWRDGRYRVYTVAHLPFEALPAYADGGPATVALGVWGVSTSSLCRAFSSPSVAAADDGMHTLSVYRFATPGGADIERHALDGTTYATGRDASRAAYEAGLLGFMVYERDAGRFGLPTVDADDDEHAQAREAWEAATGRPMGSVECPRTDDLYEMPEPGADLDALDDGA